jgi:UDP:flavonoid glycosyltransferase YjiC (YdhE family)
VPQLIILKSSSIFITHGGLNSIKEAISAEVPILVYPINKDVDHNGNSSRVVYHRLGLRGNISSETEKGLSEKIMTLLSEPGFRQNLKRMKAFEGNYPEEKLFGILKHFEVFE